MKNTTLFFDMDGVLTMFFEAWEEKLGHSYKLVNSDEEFKKASKLLSGSDFFFTLKPVVKSVELFKNCLTLFGIKPSILSSPLIDDVENTIKNKQRWLEKHIGEDNIDKKIFTRDKAQYAKGNILIDDNMQNIIKWAKAGGIGIKFKANSTKYSHLDLEKAIKKALNLAKNHEDIGMVLLLRP